MGGHFGPHQHLALNTAIRFFTFWYHLMVTQFQNHFDIFSDFPQKVMQDLRSSFGLNFVEFGPLIADCPIGPTENVRDVTYCHIYI